MLVSYQKFCCSHCSQTIEVESGHEGEIFACPSCEQPLAIPSVRLLPPPLPPHIWAPPPPTFWAWWLDLLRRFRWRKLAYLIAPALCFFFVMRAYQTVGVLSQIDVWEAQIKQALAERKGDGYALGLMLESAVLADRYGWAGALQPLARETEVNRDLQSRLERIPAVRRELEMRLGLFMILIPILLIVSISVPICVRWGHRRLAMKRIV